MGDWPLFCLAARHGTVALLDENMADYRVHGGGYWSGTNWERQFTEKARVACGLSRELPQHAGPLWNYIFEAYSWRAYECLRERRDQDARRLVRQWIGATPASHRTGAKLALAAAVSLPGGYRVGKRLKDGARAKAKRLLAALLPDAYRALKRFRDRHLGTS
jgi:hypothetical protein